MQVSIDNLTAVDGADVRMLRALLAAAEAAETGFAHDGDIGSFTNVGSSSRFDTAGFLQEWFVAEQGGESLWRSFHATANFHVNTSLPYDLNALKVREVVRVRYTRGVCILARADPVSNGEHLSYLLRCNG